jgi:aldose 1-epimerase
MRKQLFGTTRDGRTSHLYTLLNQTGLEVTLCDWGATIASLRVPDRQGRSDDVVLGYASLSEYENDRFFMGPTIGRYANRIADGEFKLNGTSYALAKNAPPNHLHGGPGGLHKQLWQAQEDEASVRDRTLSFCYRSRDGEEGFPGNLTVIARFAVAAHRNDLRIVYEATADQDTILNLTSHPYFNLAGQSSRSVLGHQLRIHAGKFTPVDSTMIPTGELRDVRGTPFDFTRLTAIGARIDADDAQLAFGAGYDHNWVLDADSGDTEVPAALLYDPICGRCLEIFTTEPGIQFYSGNSLDRTALGKIGESYASRCGLCLEPQHFPDSPNHTNFPSVVLRRGERFQSVTTYRFSQSSKNCYSPDSTGVDNPAAKRNSAGPT